MGMTPVQLFESFFEGNLLDCHDAPGDILLWFNGNGHRVKRNFQQGQWDRQGPEIC